MDVELSVQDYCRYLPQAYILSTADMLTTITQENSEPGYAFNSVGPLLKNLVLVVFATTWENSIIQEWYFGQKQQYAEKAESFARNYLRMQSPQLVESIALCCTCEEYSVSP